MGQRKVPRISLEKARSDVPADRRKAVAVFGDALRDGACRVLVSDEGPTPDAMAAVGRELLDLLEEYFGLETGALGSDASPGEAETPSPASHRLLSLFVAEDEHPVAIETPGGPQEIAARSDEWVAIPGPGLQTLTGGVVPGIRSRIDEPGQATRLVLVANPTQALLPRREFRQAEF